MKETAEMYIERPDFFKEGQTTLDGYRWEKDGDVYVKMFQGGWDERPR